MQTGEFDLRTVERIAYDCVDAMAGTVVALRTPGFLRTQYERKLGRDALVVLAAEAHSIPVVRRIVNQIIDTNTQSLSQGTRSIGKALGKAMDGARAAQTAEIHRAAVADARRHVRRGRRG